LSDILAPSGKPGGGAAPGASSARLKQAGKAARQKTNHLHWAIKVIKNSFGGLSTLLGRKRKYYSAAPPRLLVFS
jgi:hypothetical protein